MESLIVRSWPRLLERLLALHNVTSGVDNGKNLSHLAFARERTDRRRYSTDLVVVTR